MENKESRDIKSLPLDLLKEKMTELSEKPFRAKQLYDWMHVKLAGDYDEMTNLSAAFRNRLKEEYPLTTLRVVREQTSAIDGTKKFLFALPDGNLVESVWMQYKHGNSVCISSEHFRSYFRQRDGTDTFWFHPPLRSEHPEFPVP